MALFDLPVSFASARWGVHDVSSRRKSHSSRSGAALVMVLVLATTLTGAILAFLYLSRKRTAAAASELAGEQAASLSLVAAKNLVRNLQNEMYAGFGNPEAPNKAELLMAKGRSGNQLIFYPRSPRNSVPWMTVSASVPSAPPNLVKWSSRSAPFFPDTSRELFRFAASFPPAPAAASSSSADRSFNGKRVEPARWNASFLLPKKVETSTDPEPRSFPLPDWVLMTREREIPGSAFQREFDQVIGRYAYMIFDEGGLLNASVAGFPSTLDPAIVSAKGSPRLADLRTAMVDAGIRDTDSNTLNDALVRWRDGGVLVRGLPFYERFLAFHPTALWDSRAVGNRSFVSRRALMQWVLSQPIGPLSARQNFLQYVGTFSRALAEPSYYAPQPKAHSDAQPPPSILPAELGGNDLGDWDGRYPPFQRLNPPFLQVRVINPFVRVDGTSALPGDPLVRRRFALSRLGELKFDSIAAEGSKLWKLFGLARKTPSEPWEYRRGQGVILTLNEVANLPKAYAREPDFFELLKASIYPGCLAKGVPYVGPAKGVPEVAPIDADNSLDEAVIQVGANLIDQFDTDSFPTRIQFERGGVSRVINGIENLPYVYGSRTYLSVLKQPKPESYFVPTDGTAMPLFKRGAALENGEVFLWQSVSVWNPNAPASQASRSASRPEDFRLVVLSNGTFGVRSEQEEPIKDGAVTIEGHNPNLDASGSSVVGEQLLFRVDHSHPELLRSPAWLQALIAPEGIDMRRGADNLTNVDGVLDVNGQPLLGVGIAKIPRVFVVGNPPQQHTVVPSVYRFDPAPRFTYQLEYKHKNANGAVEWIPYDVKTGPPLPELRVAVPSPLALFPDPRTSRLGMVQPDKYLSESQMPSLYFRNTGDSSSDYSDADGVVRRGFGSQGGVTSPHQERAPRPVVLDRPFRSVGEMGFAFADAPWKQVDFAHAESGFAGLLDVFSLSEDPTGSVLESGRVSLNTRQWPVLKAVLAGADLAPDSDHIVPLPAGGPLSAESLAKLIVAYSSDVRPERGPFRNMSELVGRWIGPFHEGADAKGQSLYHGLADDLPKAFANAPKGGTKVELETLARALVGTCQTRVWNLLIDVIAQSGKYPANLGSNIQPRDFLVEAEKRVWVHVAIDRLTGEVLDSQTEWVNE